MYDIIVGEFYCPFCNSILTEMQTKYFEKMSLSEFTLKELKQLLQITANEKGCYATAEIHDYCEWCSSPISINIGVSPEDIKS